MAIEQCKFPFTPTSAYCNLMPRPVLMTGTLVQWLRMHFAEAERIEDPALQCAIWTSDITTTKIVIDSVYKWNPAQAEARPGLFVKRGPWKILRYGIDDRTMLSYTKSGNEVYNNFTQGSHVIFCVSNKPAETEILAAEVYRELMLFGPIARPAFNLLRFVVTDIGEMSLIEEAAEHFVVPITIAYGAQDVWEIQPNVPVLKRIDFGSQAELLSEGGEP